MIFEHDDNTKHWIGKVQAFMDEHIIPAIPVYEKQAYEGERWKVIPVVEELKAKAKKADDKAE